MAALSSFPEQWWKGFPKESIPFLVFSNNLDTMASYNSKTLKKNSWQKQFVLLAVHVHICSDYEYLLEIWEEFQM